MLMVTVTAGVTPPLPELLLLPGTPGVMDAASTCTSSGCRWEQGRTLDSPARGFAWCQ